MDIQFLNSVDIFNPGMSSLAKQLLKHIRGFYSIGSLRKESKYHYVETPDNFWAVWNQVNNRDLKISIYGTPEYYETFLKLTLYDRSYSTFYIENKRELEEAVFLIRQALDRKTGYYRY